jgi:cytoskeletal protein CcmA (bactofilin family)/microcystin-dependent protein
MSNPVKTLDVSGSFDVTGTTTLRDVSCSSITSTGNATITRTLTTTQLNVDNVITYERDLMFDTIVINRKINSEYINLRELQVWINGVNIIPVLPVSNNTSGQELGSTTEFFNKTTKLTLSALNTNTRASNIGNNQIADDTHSNEFNNTTALYIPLLTPRNAYSIQAIVLYNTATSTQNANRAINLAIELYNKATDATLSSPLVSTNNISSGVEVYRWDFPAISTYPSASFVGANSLTNIVNNTYALTQVVSIITSNSQGDLEITADLSITGSLDVIGNVDVSGSLDVIGNVDVNGSLDVSGKVGIGGTMSTEQLKVYGDVKITGNVDVDGSFNFKDIIQTTITNNILVSSQLDISNQGTGPALKVSQLGSGDGQDVALFNAGSEGDAFKIDNAGKSHFYKNVDISGNLNVGNIMNAFVPRGVILMWSGSIATIPISWSLCDGTNGTPNLRDRFIVGAGSTYAVNSNGGSSTITLTVENIPSHRHTGTTDNDGNHNHTQNLGKLDDNNFSSGSNQIPPADAGASSTTYSISSAGSDHKHNFTTGYTGYGTAFNILPPYYALAYIMKD